jgi:predicted NodU family carbamoyl transferase
MLVLGISDLEHDTAAALLGAGGVRAAIEEDKLSRSPTNGIPQMAIDRCLDERYYSRRRGLPAQTSLAKG